MNIKVIRGPETEKRLKEAFNYFVELILKKEEDKKKYDIM